jgi:PST family polysaccharide transporter
MDRNSKSRLWENFTALGIVQITNFVLPLIVIPYVIKIIGAEGFGIVSIAQVIMMFLSNVADYGFNLTATREVSLSQGDVNIISRVFFNVVSTRLIICFFLFALLLCVFASVPQWQPYRRLYLLSFVTVPAQCLLLNWLFQGMERMRIVMYISLLARIIFVVLVFAYIHTPDDKDYFIFFTGVGNLFAGLVSIIFAFIIFELRIVLPGIQAIYKEFKEGWHIMISNLSVSIFMYTNIVILGFFASKEIVGYYSVAEKIVMAARQLLSVYFQVIYPRVMQLAQSGSKALYFFFRNNYIPFLSAIGLGSIVLLVFPQPVLSIFLHGDQALAPVYLRIMSFVPLIVCLNIPAYQLLLAHNEKKTLLGVFLSGSLVNILVNYFLVTHWGAIGTCCTVLITEIIITTALVIAVNRKDTTRPYRYFI